MSENMEQIIEKESFLPYIGGLKPKGLFDILFVRSFEALMIFFSVALAVLISTEAFYRYWLKEDLFGYEEWVKLMAFWLYFTGGAYGAYNDTHVSADLVNSFMPEGRTRRTMVFIRQLLTSFLSLAFVYLGYYFFMYGLLGPLPKDILTVAWNGTGLTFNMVNLWKLKAIARTTVWQIPLWMSYAAIFIGLIFMAIYFTRRCINTGIALFKGGKEV